jgi:hypothetical protein
VAQIGLHVGGDLEPHHLSKAPAAQLVLHGAQQVVRLVGHGEVGVAGYAKHAVTQDLHAGEELVEVARDHLLERHEGRLPDRDEARQHLLGHLHPRECLVQRHRVAQPDRKAEREIRDVGEGAAGPNRQRSEHREDLLAEYAVELSQLRGVAVLAGQDADACGVERRPHPLLEQARMAGALLLHALGDGADRLERREAVIAAGVHARIHLIVQPGNPDHEELVQVGRVDREELHPLEQRDGLVLGQLQHPLVEVEPGQLAVRVSPP